MLVQESLPFISEFIKSINITIKEIAPEESLSKAQEKWLSFCLTAILISNRLCWATFERISLGKYKLSALSWMFRNSKMGWNLLLEVSIRIMLKRYGITKGIIVADDSDKKRSKVTKRIYKAHKIHDKSSGGSFHGQCVVFLLLVTEKVTIPIGFDFYMPDPAISKWNKEDKALRKQGVKKDLRPARPMRDSRYPTKQEIVLNLISEFKQNHPVVKVKLILADSLYSNRSFVNNASEIYTKAQVVSQLRGNQIILFRNRKMNLQDFFHIYPGTVQEIQVRGGKKVEMIVSSARIYVCSHKAKRFVVAIRYPENKNFRYLVASDLSWRTKDIVQGYSFRWLIEVFIEDTKLYNGYGQSAKQYDQEGSRRHLILSLLLDHCLLLHPQQVTRLENKLPASTVGSLIQKTKADSFLHFLQNFLSSGNIQDQLKSLSSSLDQFFKLSDSSKHMNHRLFPELNSTPGCTYRAKICSLSS